MQQSITVLNTLCTDLGGSGGHTYQINALNELCTLTGGTGGHTYIIQALNELCTLYSATAGHRFVIDALRALYSTLGGVGSFTTDVQYYSAIQQAGLLNVFALQDTINGVAKNIVDITKEGKIRGFDGNNIIQYDSFASLKANEAPSVLYNLTTLNAAFVGQLRYFYDLPNGNIIIYERTLVAEEIGGLWILNTTTNALTKTHTFRNEYIQLAFHWGLEFYNNTIWFSEYGVSPVESGIGTKGDATKLYRSDDNGTTWVEVYDFKNIANVITTGLHIHGVHYDRHWDRLWVTTGDDYNGTNSSKLLLWSDDAGVTWSKIDLALYWGETNTAYYNAQGLSMYSNDNYLFIGGDDYRNCIYKAAKVNKATPVILEIAYQYNTLYQDRITQFTTRWMKLSNEMIIVGLNSGDSAPRRTRIIGTTNGLNWREIWTSIETDVNHPANDLGINELNGSLYFQYADENPDTGLGRWNYAKLSVPDAVLFDSLAPTSLTATAINDTQIDLAWTNQSTNAIGHRVYISTDNINFTLKGTVTGSTAAYSATGLTNYTRYYFRVVAYRDIFEGIAAKVDKYTLLAMYLTSIGTGVGVSTLRLQASADITATLTGTAKFYTDAAGTLNESATWAITTGALRTIYLKCPSSTAKILFTDGSKITGLGNTGTGGYSSGANAARLNIDINKIVALTVIRITDGNIVISGNMPDTLTAIILATANASASFTSVPATIQTLNLQFDSVAFSASTPLPALTSLTLSSANINYTALDFAGSSNIGTLNLANWRSAKISSADMITLLTSLTNRVGNLPATVTINDYADYAAVPSNVTDAVNLLKSTKSVTTVNLGA